MSLLCRFYVTNGHILDLITYGITDSYTPIYVVCHSILEVSHFFLSSRNLRFFELMGRASFAALMAARRAFSALRILAAA